MPRSHITKSPGGNYPRRMVFELYRRMSKLYQLADNYADDDCPRTRYTRLCCSRSTKVAMVCGPNRTKLGVQPRKIHFGPSFLVSSLMTPRVVLLPDDSIRCVLTTSIGLHTVVATKLASNDAETWIAGWSPLVFATLINMFLKVSYDASWELVMNPQRKQFGQIPWVNARHPSRLFICTHASTTCL